MGMTIFDRMTAGMTQFQPSASPFATVFNVSPHSPVTALSRTSQHLDCYVCGPDGGAYSNWWNANENNGQWHAWLRIGEQNDVFPSETQFTPVARRSTDISLFAVGTNGGVYCSWWDLGVNNARWNPWFRIGRQEDVFAPHSPVTAIARTPERLDIFVAGNDGGIYSTWCEQGVDFGQWHPWFRIGRPDDIFPALTRVTAVACTPERLDIFAVGRDGGVYSSWWEQQSNYAHWNAWFRVGDFESVFPEQSSIAAVARTERQIDLLLTGHDGGVYRSSWDGKKNVVNWDRWQRIGNQSDTFPYRAKVAAVSRSEDRLEVFAIGLDGRVYGNWWHQASNNGYWGQWYPVGEESQTFPHHGQLAVLARQKEQLDLFVTGHNGGIYTSSWNALMQGGRWQPWKRI